MEIQVLYCYVAVDRSGREKIMGVTGPDKGLATPMLALTLDEALKMEPAVKEIVKNFGLSCRLKKFSSTTVLKYFDGFH